MQRALQAFNSTKRVLSSESIRLLSTMSSNNGASPANGSSNRHRARRGGGGGRGRGRGQSRPYPNLQEIPLTVVHQAQSIAQGARTMATSAAVATQIKTSVEPRSASPTSNNNNRHFSEKRFVDAPISNESKAALKYE